MYYLCTVFFMVLDLRLNEDCGCCDNNLFFFKQYIANNFKTAGRIETKIICLFFSILYKLKIQQPKRLI